MERALTFTNKTTEKGSKDSNNTCRKHGTKLISAGKEPFVVHYCPDCGKENEREKQLWEERKKKYLSAMYSDERKEKKKDYEELLASSGIPKRFHGKSLSDFENGMPNYIESKDRQEQILTDAISIINEDYCNGIFLGVPGKGKTLLASIICNSFLLKGKKCLYTKLFNMILEIKDTWGSSKGCSEKTTIDRFVNQDLLIIDEIGVQYGSDTERLYITNIIDDRYNAYRPTIFIGNLSVGKLIDLIGDRVMRRVMDNCKVLIFD